MGSPADVHLRIGPYTLRGKIEQIAEEATPEVPVPPPSKPVLNLNIFEGNSVAKSIFLVNSAGFQWSDWKRSLVLYGHQFRRFKHEGVEYTRMDYRCELAKADARP